MREDGQGGGYRSVRGGLLFFHDGDVTVEKLIFVLIVVFRRSGKHRRRGRLRQRRGRRGPWCGSGWRARGRPSRSSCLEEKSQEKKEAIERLTRVFGVGPGVGVAAASAAGDGAGVAREGGVLSDEVAAGGLLGGDPGAVLAGFAELVPGFRVLAVEGRARNEHGVDDL